MRLLSEIRRRAKAGAAPILFSLVSAYFGYHLVEGDRGLFAYLRLTHEVDKAEAALKVADAQRQKLEQRVALLRSDALDLDMLDERSRLVLGLAHPDEVVIFQPR